MKILLLSLFAFISQILYPAVSGDCNAPLPYKETVSASTANADIEKIELAAKKYNGFIYSYTISGDLLLNILKNSAVSSISITHTLPTQDGASTGTNAILVSCGAGKAVLSDKNIYTIHIASSTYNSLYDANQLARSTENVISYSDAKSGATSYVAELRNPDIDPIRSIRLERSDIMTVLDPLSSAATYDLRVHHGIGNNGERVAYMVPIDKQTGTFDNNGSIVLLDKRCLCPTNCDVW